MAVVSIPDSTRHPLDVESDWVVLHWQSLIMALPQSQVRSIELASEASRSLPSEVASGWLTIGDQPPVPVFHFDDRFRLTRGHLQSGFIVVLDLEPAWGLWGEAVNVVKAGDSLTAVSLPPIFRQNGSPLDGLAASNNGQPVMLTSAAQLQQLVSSHWSGGR
ncbi:MAG: hypothetical protein Tsb002_34910 [Wenzhouxiangellaceae bacterium]